MKDVFIKDEGDFITVGFQTEKAKEVARNDETLKTLLYGDELPKFDMLAEALRLIETYLETNGLSYEEC